MRFRVPLSKPVLLFLAGALTGSFVTLQAFPSRSVPSPAPSSSRGQVQGETTSAPVDDIAQLLGLIPSPPETARDDNPSPPDSDVSAGSYYIIDGDTIKLADGARVRYIGINAPEMDASGRDACLARAAQAANARLLEGTAIRLEKDVSDTDRYNRLLRYVWNGEVLLNEVLVSQGLATATPYPPDTRYAQTLEAAETRARDLKLGMWGDLCRGVDVTTLEDNGNTSSSTPSPTLLPKN